MNCSWKRLAGAAGLAAGLVAFPALAGQLPAPEQINYDAVPGIGANGGTGIVEWAAKSSSTPGEPVVESSISPPPGLRLRWLGTAGFEIADDETSILVDPFVSRPGYVDTLLLQKLPIDTAAVDKYVFDPMGPDLSRLKAVLVSHTHHDHAQDVPYVLAKYPHAADRPLVVGDVNVRQLLKLYDGRVRENPWLAGVDDLSKSPQKILEFDKCQMENPSPEHDVGFQVGTFGNFKVTAFINWHGLYDIYTNIRIKGRMLGKPPFISTDYRAYLYESMSYLITYKDKFRIFATDSARFLNGERVAWEIWRDGGPVDILLQGIASRKKDNRLADRVEWFAPRYIVPTHYDNFFLPMDQMVNWEYRIFLPNDNSLLKEFLDDSCGTEIRPPCPPIRMTKFGYYYGLENLIRR